MAAFAQYQSPSSPAQAVPANTAPADPSPAQPAAQPAAPAADLHDVKMGPAARHMMAQLGLSPSQVQGTAWQGIITKGDVMAAVAVSGVASGVVGEPKLGEGGGSDCVSRRSARVKARRLG